MVSGVGDLTFNGLVFSWFLLTGRITDQGQELQLHAVQKLWPSYCTSSGVRITLSKLTPPICVSHTCSSPDLTSNHTRELPSD